MRAAHHLDGGFDAPPGLGLIGRAALGAELRFVGGVRDRLVAARVQEQPGVIMYLQFVDPGVCLHGHPRFYWDGNASVDLELPEGSAKTLSNHAKWYVNHSLTIRSHTSRADAGDGEKRAFRLNKERVVSKGAPHARHHGVASDRVRRGGAGGGRRSRGSHWQRSCPVA